MEKVIICSIIANKSLLLREVLSVSQFIRK